jgi:hypothetical protein
MRVPFLGAIPLEPLIAEASDGGQAFVSRFAASPTAATMREIIRPIAALAGGPPAGQAAASNTPRAN